ncbi:hypothetical protein, partial [Vibrio harveyi]
GRYTNGESMNQDQLIENYKNILSSINSSDFILGKDLYSGVFLSQPFSQYYISNKKVMVVGRETSGWNTKNGKNSFNRIIQANQSNTLDTVISESLERYSWHLLDRKGGDIKKSSSSWFQRFYLNLSKKLDLNPHALIYENLYSWDFNGKSPKNRKKSEFSHIQELSVQLLAASIQSAKPDVIIFAVGCNKKNDQTIKLLCNQHLGGYVNKEIVKGKYWEFETNDIKCIRIAHPRAQSNEHPYYREKAMDTVVTTFV